MILKELSSLTSSANSPKVPAGMSPSADTNAGLPLPPAVIERVADRFRLLGDPTRLRLMNALHSEGELSVGDLVERTSMSYGAVSKQLALLRSHGALRRRRDGTRIYYSIADPTFDELCDTVCRTIREDWNRWGAAVEPNPTI